MYELDIRELPFTPDEQASIVKKTPVGDVRCEPVQIIRNGDAAGVWRETRLWLNISGTEHLIGYVRIDLKAQIITTRTRYTNSVHNAIWSFGVTGDLPSIPTALKRACHFLAHMYVYTK